MPADREQLLKKAAALWQNDRPMDAGEMIFEDLHPDTRPQWAIGILKLVLERDRMDRGSFRRLLGIAEHPRLWADGHRVFDYLRGEVLRIDELRKTRELTHEQSAHLGALCLAELVAKVTYNAADPSDPFDEDSGWWLTAQLRGFVDLWQDDQFSQAAWSALCDQPPLPAGRCERVEGTPSGTMSSANQSGNPGGERVTDAATIIARLEREWDLDTGFFGILKGGRLDSVSLERLVRTLELINFDGHEFVNRRLVSLLWFMPQFMTWQTEHVQKMGGDPVEFGNALILVYNITVRILGMP